MVRYDDIIDKDTAETIEEIYGSIYRAPKSEMVYAIAQKPAILPILQKEDTLTTMDGALDWACGSLDKICPAYKWGTLWDIKAASEPGSYEALSLIGVIDRKLSFEEQQEIIRESAQRRRLS